MPILLQGIFLTQESNQGLLHCRRILYQLSYQGSPNQLYPNKNSLKKKKKRKGIASLGRKRWAIGRVSSTLLYRARSYPFLKLNSWVPSSEKPSLPNLPENSQASPEISQPSGCCCPMDILLSFFLFYLAGPDFSCSTQDLYLSCGM